MLPTAFCMAISSACSLVILAGWAAEETAGREPSMEGRGVCAGVVAVDAVLFLEDLKKVMAANVLVGEEERNLNLDGLEE